MTITKRDNTELTAEDAANMVQNVRYIEDNEIPNFLTAEDAAKQKHQINGVRTPESFICPLEEVKDLDESSQEFWDIVLKKSEEVKEKGSKNWTYEEMKFIEWILLWAQRQDYTEQKEITKAAKKAEYELKKQQRLDKNKESNTNNE